MSELRPGLTGRTTSATLHQRDDPSVPLGEQPLGQDGEELIHRSGSGPHIQDLLALAAIIIMLVWPWAFFGAVWIRGGVQLSNHMAKVVTNSPHATTYFVTLICSIISMITSALFSLSIIRFAQELVTFRGPTPPFHLRVLLAFRHQNWPWGKSVKGAKYLIHRNRWWPAVLLIVCILTFPHLISSTTSLLAPIPFARTVELTGTEVDFSGVDCEAWFNTNPLTNDCGYQYYEGRPFTNCLGEDQLVDVLESGRGNILSLLTENNQSLTFSQLSANGGLHFLGPIRGVLPNGPNGAPEFGTLEASPLSNPNIMAGTTSYNYTLMQQGLFSNVSCRYTASAGFVPQALDSPQHPFAIAYNLSCSKLGEIDVLTNVTALQSAWGTSVLAYWACQSAPLNGVPTNSYSIYLAGLGSYSTTFGDITCSLTPVQPAIFPVTYQSTKNIFTIGQQTLGSTNVTFPNLLTYALVGLAAIISEGQGFQSNPVAESVLTFAYKSWNVSINAAQSPQYLRLFEQMIQGIIEYEATYLRLIYSTVGDNRPSTCNRTVTGFVNYEVVGWFVTPANIGFLIPITIINGAAFVALVLAMWIAWTHGHIFHPFHPRSVTVAEHDDEEEGVPDEWSHHIAYHPTTLLKEFFRKDVAGNLEKGFKAVVHGVEKVGQEFVAGPSSDRQQQDIAPADDRPQQDIAPADDKLQENVAPADDSLQKNVAR